MLFRHLIWTALVVALAMGSLQTALQHRWAVPVILAAEVFEAGATSQATESSSTHQDGHSHDDAHAYPAQLLAGSHEHEPAQEWAPADGYERTFWSWVANVLDTLALTLLAFAALATAQLVSNRRGDRAVRAFPAGMVVAAMGWFSLHLWPALGLPVELPGMEAADLTARQGWWLWAVVSALAACALLTLSRQSWRWPLAALLLALPFVAGAPHLAGDPLAAFGPEAQAQMRELQVRFGLVSHLLAATQWLGIGCLGGWLFARWVLPHLTQPMRRGTTSIPLKQTP